MFLLIPERRVETISRSRTLHSNMFLLIHYGIRKIEKSQLSLHSNMFLLILDPLHQCIEDIVIFTFQYVSINTTICPAAVIAVSNFTFQYVSINTMYPRFYTPAVSAFTFQYVSINTSNRNSQKENRKNLYIPICFY